MNTDLVSIILPVYNGEPYLASSIESIISQTHKNFELLILDDGSTDNSLQTIKTYAERDKRIKYLSRKNKGLGETLNELIDLCTSDYVARMDSDDISEPDRISIQYAFMKNHKDVGMIGGQIKFLVGEKILRANPMPQGSSAIRSMLMDKRFPICHPAIMFRKSISRKIGGYKVSGAGEDLDFFLRFSEIAILINIPEYVLRYRVHLNSLSVNKSYELNKSYAFSVENARRRLLHLNELTFYEFDKIWRERSFFLRTQLKIKTISEIFYRKSIIYRSKDRTLYSYLFLTIAALCRPQIALKRILHKFLLYEKN